MRVNNRERKNRRNEKREMAGSNTATVPGGLEKLVACSFKAAITIVIAIDWKPRNIVRLRLEQNLPRWA